MFDVDICFLTMLKLASGKACDCNDRSGMKFQGKYLFFYVA